MGWNSCKFCHSWLTDKNKCLNETFENILCNKCYEINEITDREMVEVILDLGK